MKKILLPLFVFIYSVVTSSLFHVFSMGHSIGHGDMASMHHTNATVSHGCDDTSVGGCVDICIGIENATSTVCHNYIENIIIPVAVIPSYTTASVETKQYISFLTNVSPHKPFFSVILVGIQKLTI